MTNNNKKKIAKKLSRNCKKVEKKLLKKLAKSCYKILKRVGEEGERGEEEGEL
jgi:hypothetical protein